MSVSCFSEKIKTERDCEKISPYLGGCLFLLLSFVMARRGLGGVSTRVLPTTIGSDSVVGHDEVSRVLEITCARIYAKQGSDGSLERW